MSEENTSVETQEQAIQPASSGRGDKGVVGTASAGLGIWQQWQAGGKQGSLKQFARLPAAEGNQVAKDWFGNKLGRLEKGRSDANIKAAKEASMKTKEAKRKKK